MDYVDLGGESFIGCIQKLEREAAFSVNALLPLRGIMDKTLKEKMVNALAFRQLDLKGMTSECERLTHQQWVTWHWEAAPASVITPQKSVFPPLGHTRVLHYMPLNYNPIPFPAHGP